MLIVAFAFHVSPPFQLSALQRTPYSLWLNDVTGTFIMCQHFFLKFNYEIFNSEKFLNVQKMHHPDITNVLPYRLQISS